jgi:cysteine desulfurase/selenocysteine lyase
MTTPTPTSDLPGAAGGSSGAGLAGLPDVATLNELAGQFFALLPGQTSLPASASNATSPSTYQPGHAPQAPQSELSLGQRAPALAPVSTTTSGVPDRVVQDAPGAGRAGGPALGVPEAYAASLPTVALGSAVPVTSEALPDAPVPSTPYYFLGEASGYPSAAPGAASLPGSDRVTAQSFGLPGADDLRSLLSGLDSADGHPATGEPVAYRQQPSSSPSFYFLDPASVPRADASARPPFDVHAVRRDFPILSERVNGRQLVWFDNAATTHKPQSVIDRIAWFYAHENSNIHRAAHELAARATDAYESARHKVTRFIGAASPEEIIFVRGATEAINLVAKSWGAKHIREGDEIIVSNLEHHANIVPWQQLAAEKGARIRVIPVDDTGQVLLEEYKRLLNDRTKLVAVTQVSNALGTVVPVKEIVELAHRAGAKALVDGAQSVSHMRVDVQAIDADFFVFSGHKVFAPTGIGVVYGKRAILEDMPPWQGGGNMIQDVTFERTIYHGPPARFEAGTGNIADAVGLGAAIDYVERIGIENIARYEHDLLAYATQHLLTIPGLRLIGTAADKASVASFVLQGYKTEEVGHALNEEGIAVRSGHHCAQPILRRFGVEATVRPSLAFYNTCQEVDSMIAVLRRLVAHRR